MTSSCCTSLAPFRARTFFRDGKARTLDFDEPAVLPVGFLIPVARLLLFNEEI